MTIDFATIVPKLDLVLARGLSQGLGTAGGQVCVEAAICEVLGLPHGDELRRYKIRLNDAGWSSPAARAKGMRSLAIAQLGTAGLFFPGEFVTAITVRTIQVLIPALFRAVLPELEAVSLRCEIEGTREAAWDAALEPAAEAAWAEAAAAKSPDFYLLLSASLALDVLREKKVPGMAFL